ncbi:MAG: NAD-dependent epimerase/dehydratase family protein [Actinobacteria bacterium]|nr:NAD-dependent epimerase/dehydratase family protein [Actinomycetota bacterium]
MNVLVTGADKILGYNLIRYLQEEGHAVKALLDPQVKAPSLVEVDAEIVPGNILDPESLQSSLKDIEAVFHCEMYYKFFPPRTEFAWAVNLEGTRNLLIGMARAGVENLVYVNSASSFGYGTEDEPANEDGLYNCEIFNSPCLDSLRRAQELVKRYNDTGRIRAVILNPTVPLGTNETPEGLGTGLIEFVQNHRGWYSTGGLNVASAPDIAKAILRALDHGKPGRAYILGGHNISNYELYRKICSHLGIAPPTRLANENKFMALGRAGSLYWKITGRNPAFTIETSKMATATFYYSSARAAGELGLGISPLDPVLEEACRWYKQNIRRSVASVVE